MNISLNLNMYKIIEHILKGQNSFLKDDIWGCKTVHISKKMPYVVGSNKQKLPTCIQERAQYKINKLLLLLFTYHDVLHWNYVEVKMIHKKMEENE